RWLIGTERAFNAERPAVAARHFGVLAEQISHLGLPARQVVFQLASQSKITARAEPIHAARSGPRQARRLQRRFFKTYLIASRIKLPLHHQVHQRFGPGWLGRLTDDEGAQVEFHLAACLSESSLNLEGTIKGPGKWLSGQCRQPAL